MAQVKVYGVGRNLNPVQSKLSDGIYSSIMDGLQFPPDKLAHHIFPTEPTDFFIPGGRGRTDWYTFIESSMLESRTVETKQQLFRLLFERLNAQTGTAPADAEMTISEIPKQNWGFRGRTGDEIGLHYAAEV